ARAIEGARCAFGLVVPDTGGLKRTKTSNSEWVDHRIRPTGEHPPATAAADQTESRTHRIGASGAGRDVNQRWRTQAVTVSQQMDTKIARRLHQAEPSCELRR